MKIRLSELRRIIREELGMPPGVLPGFGGMGGVSGLTRHKGEISPQLGDEFSNQESDQDKHEQKDEEQKFQWTVNARKKRERR